MLPIEANLVTTIASFSRAGDLSNLTFVAHAKRVAHISFHIAKALTLSKTELNQLVLSALLHDVGVMTDEEQLHLADQNQ